MKRLGSGLSFLFSAACLVFCVGAVNNVYGDSREVDRLAHQTACGDQGSHCNAHMTAWSRNAMGQTFTFAIGKRTTMVTCGRSFYVFGEHTCASR